MDVVRRVLSDSRHSDRDLAGPSDGLSGNWMKCSEIPKKGLAKEEHDGYDSRHVNLPDDIVYLIFQYSADYG